MDISFYLQQGQKLLENKDSASVIKALEYFKKANEMTEDGLAKPKILYLLAVGNYRIGNIEQAYRIASKAKRKIDLALIDGLFLIDNIKEVLGENAIDDFLLYLNQKYPRLALLTDIKNELNENELNLENLIKNNVSSKKSEIKPLFTLENLSDEIIMATFHSLNSNDDDPIYFDKLEGNIFSYVEGYLYPLVGNRKIADRRLVEKITNDEPVDYIDDDRYILFDKLKLSDFITEYKIQSKGKEPFASFVDYFLTEILKGYTHQDFLTIQSINSTNHIQQKFHELFQIKYQNRVLELRDDFFYIHQNTSKAIARNWINCKILNITL